MENKNKLMALCCMIAAIIASCYNTSMTVKFFADYSQDIWLMAFFVGIGLTIDFGMIAFSILVGMLLAKERYLKAFGYSCLMLMCMAASFFASQCYDLNNANKILNKTVANSSAMTRQNDSYEKKSTEITDLQSTIKQLKDNRKADEQKIRTDYKPLIDNARKLNMLTIHKDSVAELTKRMNNDIKQLDTDIKNKEMYLSKCMDDLTGINKGYQDIGKNTRTTEGFYAIAVWIDKNNPESVVGKINVAKNLLILILTVAFGIAFGDFAGRNEGQSFFSNIKSKFKRIFSHKPKDTSPVTAKSDYKIGFHMNDDNVKSNGITNELLAIYKEYMTQNAKDNGQVPSYCTAACDLDIDNTLSYSCRKMLIEKGILQKDDKRNLTYLKR